MVYDLFLFDFDGLLVDTESLHYKAYQAVIDALGLSLTWSFSEYCQKAQISSPYLHEQLVVHVPELKKYDWDTLYKAKKTAYLDLLSAYPLQLMPGVAPFLEELEQRKMPHAVVTHSPKEQINAICKRLPKLSSIPHWFTREDYQEAKPAPDGYLTAWKTLGGEHPIGFEDSVRGLQSLNAAGITPVLIRPEYYPPLDPKVCEGALCAHSFTEIGLERFFPSI